MSIEHGANNQEQPHHKEITSHQKELLTLVLSTNWNSEPYYSIYQLGVDIFQDEKKFFNWLTKPSLYLNHSQIQTNITLHPEDTIYHIMELIEHHPRPKSQKTPYDFIIDGKPDELYNYLEKLDRGDCT